MQQDTRTEDIYYKSLLEECVDQCRRGGINSPIFWTNKVSVIFSLHHHHIILIVIIVIVRPPDQAAPLHDLCWNIIASQIRFGKYSRTLLEV